MKVGQIGPTFSVPGKTSNLFGAKTVVPTSILKMRKSHKKISTVHTHTPNTQTRDGANLINFDNFDKF